MAKIQKLSLLERREGDLVSGMEPQGCGTGPTMGSCEGWRGDRSQPKPPLLLRGLCRVSWQAAGADEARLGLQCGSRKGLFLSISIPCYQGSAAGREGRRQGPRHRGCGGTQPCQGQDRGDRMTPGSPSPASVITHTSFSFSSAFNPFGYKTRPKNLRKGTRTAGRGHSPPCQDESRSRSSAAGLSGG